MIHDCLRSIAQQFHSGKHVIDMDFGGAQLQQVDKLYRVHLALRMYPTLDSTAAGSNEVVSPEPPGPPQNIRQLLVRQQSPTAVPPSNLKVHWKLKITAWRQKQRLYLDLLWIEESLQNAYGDFDDGVGEWQPVERLYLEYGEAINRANAFIAAVYDDQERYYWNKSKAWLASGMPMSAGCCATRAKQTLGSTRQTFLANLASAS